VSEQYREVSGGVTERSRKLAQITEELESVKQEMDERGSSMTDGSMSQRDIMSLLVLQPAVSHTEYVVCNWDVQHVADLMPGCSLSKIFIKNFLRNYVAHID
jgi:hypothetical protein